MKAWHSSTRHALGEFQSRGDGSPERSEGTPSRRVVRKCIDRRTMLTHLLYMRCIRYVGAEDFLVLAGERSDEMSVKLFSAVDHLEKGQ